MKTRYLFGASLPRSCTKLYTYTLSANYKIMIASNPKEEYGIAKKLRAHIKIK